MTVGCNKGCGMTWRRHPALEVPCSECKAKVGSHCRRPSGHECTYHKPRILQAYDEGHFKECPWNICRPDERPLPSERQGLDLPLFSEKGETHGQKQTP